MNKNFKTLLRNLLVDYIVIYKIKLTHKQKFSFFSLKALDFRGKVNQRMLILRRLETAVNQNYVFYDWFWIMIDLFTENYSTSSWKHFDFHGNFFEILIFRDLSFLFLKLSRNVTIKRSSIIFGLQKWNYYVVQEFFVRNFYFNNEC